MANSSMIALPDYSNYFDRSKVISEILTHAALVSPPSLALQVIAAASKPDCTPGEIRDLLSQDPALCAKVLKTVNSCLFGFVHPISTVDRAVIVLGLNATRSLVLGLSLPILQGGAKASDPILKSFWSSSVSGSIIARELSKYLGHYSPVLDQVAGLLRNIGAMMLYQVYPATWEENLTYQYPDILQNPLPREEELFGVNHAEVGAELLRKWNLPQELLEPIRWHHTPDRLSMMPPVMAERAELLGFVDSLTQLEAVVENPELLENLLSTAETKFQLPQGKFMEFLRTVTQEIESYIKLLNLNVKEVPDYHLILAQSCETLGKLESEPNTE